MPFTYEIIAHRLRQYGYNIDLEWGYSLESWHYFTVRKACRHCDPLPECARTAQMKQAPSLQQATPEPGHPEYITDVSVMYKPLSYRRPLAA